MNKKNHNLEGFARIAKKKSIGNQNWWLKWISKRIESKQMLRPECKFVFVYLFLLAIVLFLPSEKEKHK